ELKLTLKARFLGLGRQFIVTASCLRHRVSIADAYIGCPLCNQERPGLDLFRQALEQVEDD
ncbi:MAG: hypothetical protein H7Y11_03585, partial [Armatimonadetes bacterium]|nr:hypothetical protein [Anaerolineae bacterium]